MAAESRVRSRPDIRLLAIIARRREAGPLIVLLALVTYFQIDSGKFFTANQLEGMATIAASIAIISAGVTLLMISGEFDLSVAANYGLAPILFVILLNDWDLPVWLALPAAMAIVAGIGALNGLITTRFGIPSLITTLGAAFAITGVKNFITGGDSLLYFDDSTILSVLGAKIGDSAIIAPFLWAVGIVVLLSYVTESTRYGNWSRAAGGSGDVAREMGVPVNRVKTFNFVMSASFAGFAGITTFANFRTVSSGYGSDYELLAIVATVVGGTSIFGVTGSIAGAFIGTLIISSLRTGLILVGAPGSWYTSIIGLVLIGAVIANIRIHKVANRLLEFTHRTRAGAQ